MKSHCLRKIDFLKIPISLSFKNNSFYETNVGAILTILFFFMIMNLTIYQIILLSTKNSFTLISNQYTDLSQSIDFSKTPFLFELTNNNGQLIEMDNKLFVIEAFNTQMDIKRYKNGTTQRIFSNTKLELEKCDNIFLNSSEYSELNLSRYICIKPNQNLTTYGLVGDINYPFKGIRIYINKCSGSYCYEGSEIVKKLNNAKFSNIFKSKFKYVLFKK